MKEATGELNMTVVTVVAIAAVAAFFYAFVWPNIKSSITSSTKCANAQCSQSSCTTNNGQTVCTHCTTMDESGKESEAFTCRYQDGESKK